MGQQRSLQPLPCRPHSPTVPRVTHPTHPDPLGSRAQAFRTFGRAQIIDSVLAPPSPTSFATPTRRLRLRPRLQLSFAAALSAALSVALRAALPVAVAAAVLTALLAFSALKCETLLTRSVVCVCV